MHKINLFIFEETFLPRTFMTLFALALGYINKILRQQSVRLSWYSGNAYDYHGKCTWTESCPNENFVKLFRQMKNQ